MSILFDRRAFLLGASTLGASLATPSLLRAATPTVSGDRFVELRPAPTTAQLFGPSYGTTDVWAYGGSVPGPEIRLKAGERVRQRLVNGLPQNTAVHWHGIRIDNAMDGAVGLTQDPVKPGGTFDYDFVAPDPGTYWYHSHDRSWEQVARGLSGPLIVEDIEPWIGLEGAATRELTVALDDWLLRPDAKIEEANFGALPEWAHAGRIGNMFTVNGKIGSELPVRAGERLRLRLLNVSNARIMPIRIEDHDVKLIALDGHPVAPRDASDGVVLTPAQRADIVIDCLSKPGARVPVMLDAGRDQWVDIATLVYSDEQRLPDCGIRYPTATDVDASHPRHRRSAARNLDDGRWCNGQPHPRASEGVDRDIEELVAAKRVWAFNGVAGDLYEPIFRTHRGRTIHLTIRNTTGFPARHPRPRTSLHDPKPQRHVEPYRDRRDTVLTVRDEVVEIAFEADNPASGSCIVTCSNIRPLEWWPGLKSGKPCAVEQDSAGACLVQQVDEFHELCTLLVRIARPDGIFDAMMGMVGNHKFFDTFQRRANGRSLGENIDAIAILFDHSCNSANLAFEPFQPFQRFVFVIDHGPQNRHRGEDVEIIRLEPTK